MDSSTSSIPSVLSEFAAVQSGGWASFLPSSFHTLFYGRRSTESTSNINYQRTIADCFVGVISNSKCSIGASDAFTETGCTSFHEDDDGKKQPELENCLLRAEQIHQQHPSLPLLLIVARASRLTRSPRLLESYIARAKTVNMHIISCLEGIYTAVHVGINDGWTQLREAVADEQKTSRKIALTFQLARAVHSEESRDANAAVTRSVAAELGIELLQDEITTTPPSTHRSTPDSHPERGRMRCIHSNHEGGRQLKGRAAAYSYRANDTHDVIENIDSSSDLQRVCNTCYGKYYRKNPRVRYE